MAGHSLEQEYGYECHDCGETFAPGVTTAACTDKGHYVAPITACEVPFLFPAKDS